MVTSEIATLEQLKEMKKRLDGCSSYYVLMDDRGVIESSEYFIIWDDDNLMLHTIDASGEMDAQYYAPFRIRSFAYDWIEQIVGLFQGGKSVTYNFKGGFIE